MVNDFADFAFETSKRVSEEETLKLLEKMKTDLHEIVTQWVEDLTSNINERLAGLGLDSSFEVTIAWEPIKPTISIYGENYRENETA